MDRTERYIVIAASVGDAGLTQRPSVWDMQEQRTIHTFRKGEDLAAQHLADEMNQGRRYDDKPRASKPKLDPRFKAHI